jgi:amino acid adenylation domain-containing protein/thioester reductase-like protein
MSSSPPFSAGSAPLDERLARLTPQQRELLLRNLAQRATSKQAADSAEAPRAMAGQPLPLTPAQQQIWVFERLQPGTPAYHVFNHFRLEGALDLHAFERAWTMLVQRHDALRISFAERAGEPVQTIVETVDLPVKVIDLSDVPEERRERELQRCIGEEALRPFDLSRAPLLRIAVVRLSPVSNAMLMATHHLVSDVWSLGILQAELAAFYNAFRAGRDPELPAKTLQFGDVALRQTLPAQKRRNEAQLRYWKDALSGTTGLLDLPTDRPRTALASAEGARYVLRFPDGLRDATAELARGEGATQFMVMLCAFQALLARWSGDSDIVIGTPVANRRTMEEEAVVGLFVNTVAVRADFGDDPSFRQALARAKSQVLYALENAEAPLEHVIEQLSLERAPGRSPLFQTMFVYQNSSATDIGMDGLRAAYIEPDTDTARFELTLSLSEGPAGLSGLIDYGTQFFAAPTIARLAQHFVALLRGVTANPDLPLSRIPLLDDEERAALAALGDGGPALPSPSDTLQGLFALQAARTPQAAALVEPGREWTYSQVLRRANGIAQALHAQDIGPGAYVAVLSDRSADAVIAVLGVLLAGAAYLPLDPASPDERLQFLLQDAGAAALLVPPLLRERATTLAPGIPVLHVGTIAEAETAPHVEVGAGDPAYLIYTSGSTGTPKGVVVEHRGAVNLVQGFLARHRFDDQRLLMIPPLIFDASVGDVFPALACGSALVLHPAPTELGPFELERFCRDHGVTAIDAPAALWRRWSEGWATRTQGEPLLPALNLMMIGGESVPVDQVRRFAGVTGGRVVLCNHYGPTEASVCATLLSTVDASEIATHDLPAGRPLPGVRIHLLDRHLQPVPRGVVGELFIGGAGVARGYLNAAELTSERFLVDPFSHEPGARMYRTGDLARWNADDTLQFIGRRDHQIKLRGFRIELGEIDNALAALAGVQAVAVLLREDRPGDRRLVAYAVVADGADAAVLRAGLARRLPEAMLPSAFVFLDAMPLTANGKIDRRALPAPGEDAAAERAIRDPQTPTEHTVLAIWRDVLGRESLSTDDDFFASGGDSLSTLPLVFKLHEALGIELPLSAVFATPTVAGLSATIDRMLAGEAVEAFDIEAQVVLPESIDGARVAPPVAPRAAPKSVLLTGATGFLGAYVLRDLIDLSAAEVVCLVRADSAEDGIRRIRSNLESYGLWREGDDARLAPVLGDLSSQLLGLTPSAFEALAQRVDAIVHNGGQVNFIAPYAHLEAANVGGTREVLRLATTAHLKPVQLVSTLGVYVTPLHSGVNVAETHAPPDGPGQDGGYNQSKWVGEQLGLLARARGVPLAIHRPARITGDGVSGISNPGDYFNAWIRGCVQLGKAPYAPDDFFDMTPVDYVARTIVRVLLGAGDANGNYHYFNPHTLPVTEAVAAIRERVCPIEEVDYRQWRQALMASIAAGEDNALKPFAGLFAEAPDPTQSSAAATDDDVQRIPVFDCTATEAIGAPWCERCLPADRALFERYLRFLQSRGALPAIAAANA